LFKAYVAKMCSYAHSITLSIDPFKTTHILHHYRVVQINAHVITYQTGLYIDMCQSL